MDKLNALKYFCTAADTLQFRETAQRLSVSPQVVTRVIAELENYLGEALFVRSTRNVQLTDFGVRFLPEAQQLLADSERLFTAARTRTPADEMRGTVRITLPFLPENDAIIAALFARCAEYPDLQPDWRVNAARLNNVENQIDIGLRIGSEPESWMVVRHLGYTRELLVAAPSLVEKLGLPADLDDLLARYPTGSQININTGRSWGWPISNTVQVMPKNPRFVCDDAYSELAAVLAGAICALIGDSYCRPHLAAGRLVELLPELERYRWPVFLYRPQRSITSPRVLAVFDWLTDIIGGMYGGNNAADRARLL